MPAMSATGPTSVAAPPARTVFPTLDPVTNQMVYGSNGSSAAANGSSTTAGGSMATCVAAPPARTVFYTAGGAVKNVPANRPTTIATATPQPASLSNESSPVMSARQQQQQQQQQGQSTFFLSGQSQWGHRQGGGSSAFLAAPHLVHGEHL